MASEKRLIGDVSVSKCACCVHNVLEFGYRKTVAGLFDGLTDYDDKWSMF